MIAGAGAETVMSVTAGKSVAGAVEARAKAMGVN